MGKRTINNQRITPRVFENDIAEALSHVHPATPLVLYLPVVIFLTYRATTFMDDGLAIAGLFIAGIAFWTLTEYLLHRYLFHFDFKSDFGKTVHFMIHGIHHDYPRDPKRLVIPASISIPLAALFYLGFVVLLGEAVAQASFAGFLFGYVCYDTIHYATHHFSMKNSRVGQLLKRHHLKHHYQDEHLGYGVSSPLWDYVFGTIDRSVAKTPRPNVSERRPPRPDSSPQSLHS